MWKNNDFALQKGPKTSQDASKMAFGLLLVRSGSLLGRSWLLLGCSWPLLARSRSVLGRSWPLLGPSWRFLNRSWSLLGRSGCDPGGGTQITTQRLRKSQGSFAIYPSKDGISTALSIYLSIDPVLVALIPGRSGPEMYCFSIASNFFVASRRPLGALSGRSWAVLGTFARFLAALGPLLAALGPLLGALGPLLGALGLLLASLGRPWAALGRAWGALGLLLGRIWWALGRSWGALGVLFGCSWTLLGCTWGAPGRSCGLKGLKCATLEPQAFFLFWGRVVAGERH